MDGWLSQQKEKYVLVKETFQCLGYPSLEEVCEKEGGFVEKEEQLNEVEEQCYDILEKVCKNIFYGFFIVEKTWPERRIIRNNKAVYHGMAVICPLVDTSRGAWNLFEDKIENARINVNSEFKNIRFSCCNGTMIGDTVILDGTLYPYEFAGFELY